MQDTIEKLEEQQEAFGVDYSGEGSYSDAEFEGLDFF